MQNVTMTNNVSDTPIASVDWNFSNVKTFLHERECVSLKDLDHLQREYMCYMKLVAENRNIKLPVSPQVDQFWHAHILFSRDYTDFSNRMIGEYIHHYPALSQEDRINLAPNYVLTRQLYHKKFGAPSEKWWPSDCICSSCTGPGGGCVNDN